ncbi:MAG: hypothetical protein WC529_03650 [Candidatus Margulisiibacteriota bacterium]
MTIKRNSWTWLIFLLVLLWALPAQAYFRIPVTYGTLFERGPDTSLLGQSEKEALLNIIKMTASGEGQGLLIESVGALNDYNFGVLINDMIGSLYRSHGCLHMAPRSVFLASRLLPIGTKIIVKGGKDLADPSYEQLPTLTSLIDFAADIKALAPRFARPAAVTVTVYPASSLWVIFLDGEPFAKIKIQSGPSTAVKVVQSREGLGQPTFSADIAYPTSAATFYVFKKPVNYVSGIYHDTTVIPQDAQLKKTGGQWNFLNEGGNWAKVPGIVADDLNAPAAKQVYLYYNVATDESGNVVKARWGSNEFGKYPIQLSRDRKTSAAELAHTSGDLMMEQRQMVRELIKVLAAPKDTFEDCAKYSKNFELYLACYDFIRDPNTPDLIEPAGSASYKLALNLPLTSAEAAEVPPDVFVAYKVAGDIPLTTAESDLLVSEGIAKREGAELKIDRLKTQGLINDINEYVVSIKKNANIYATLKSRWAGLAPLRRALLNDLTKFKISDPVVFHAYVQELVLQRLALARLTQDDAYQVLNSLLEE